MVHKLLDRSRKEIEEENQLTYTEESFLSFDYLIARHFQGILKPANKSDRRGQRSQRILLGGCIQVSLLDAACIDIAYLIYMICMF